MIGLAETRMIQNHLKEILLWVIQIHTSGTIKHSKPKQHNCKTLEFSRDHQKTMALSAVLNTQKTRNKLERSTKIRKICCRHF